MRSDVESCEVNLQSMISSCSIRWIDWDRISIADRWSLGSALVHDKVHNTEPMLQTRTVMRRGTHFEATIRSCDFPPNVPHLPRHPQMYIYYHISSMALDRVVQTSNETLLASHASSSSVHLHPHTGILYLLPMWISQERNHSDRTTPTAACRGVCGTSAVQAFSAKEPCAQLFEPKWKQIEREHATCLERSPGQRYTYPTCFARLFGIVEDVDYGVRVLPSGHLHHGSKQLWRSSLSCLQKKFNRQNTRQENKHTQKTNK